MWDGSTITQQESDARNASIDAFLLTKTKAELFEAAVEKGMLLAPCNTVKDVLESPQLKARNFWEPVKHPELDDVLTYPGAPVKMTETPWKIHRRAPLIGEHNEEVYLKELGLSREELALLKANGVI